MFELLSPAERLYLVVADLEFYRNLHQLNATLKDVSNLNNDFKSHKINLEKDLSWLKVDPLEFVQTEHKPHYGESYSIFATDLKNKLSFMFPHNHPDSEKY